MKLTKSGDLEENYQFQETNRSVIEQLCLDL